MDELYCDGLSSDEIMLDKEAVYMSNTQDEKYEITRGHNGT